MIRLQRNHWYILLGLLLTAALIAGGMFAWKEYQVNALEDTNASRVRSVLNDKNKLSATAAELRKERDAAQTARDAAIEQNATLQGKVGSLEGELDSTKSDLNAARERVVAPSRASRSGSLVAPASAPPPPPTNTNTDNCGAGGTPAENRALGECMMLKQFAASQFTCLDTLWGAKESGWSTTADNPYSSAYGIPQSTPGNKMASVAPDWRTNPVTQITWGLNYIKGRYGTPCAALAFRNRAGWY